MAKTKRAKGAEGGAEVAAAAGTTSEHEVQPVPTATEDSGRDASGEFRAVHRYARTGARKARLVVDMIRGLPVNRVLDDLRHDKHRAARLVEKVVKSAVSNALQNDEVRANRLVVSRAWVGDGPLLFGRLRFRPGPMGRAMPIRKRTCHIHVYVVDHGLSNAASSPGAKKARGGKRGGSRGAEVAE